MNSFSQRFQHVLHVKKIKQNILASLLDVNQVTISRWKKQTDAPLEENIKKIAKVTGCNIDWLRDGNGEPFPKKKHGTVIESIEPSPGKKKSAHQRQEKEISSPTDSDWTISEMLTATTRVLESNTIYRGALASNIRAFDKAVQMEIEMEGIKEDVKAMRKDNREMADRMERMEELLVSLGATTQEKRDSAASS